MASTIDTGFRMLEALLEMSKDQRIAIVRNQGKIEKAISKSFDTHGTELAGAYLRNTTIAAKKGIVVDLFLLLRADYGRNNTAADLLDKLQEALFKLSKKSSVCPDGHGVIVPLSDYRFIVVPCFHKENKGYVIPDYNNDQWLTTNPKAYSDLLIQQNKWHEGHLLPIIKLIKCWNQTIGNMFDEYYLELLVVSVLTDIPPINKYSSTVRYIFRQAVKQVVFTIDDPARLGEQVQGVHDSSKLVEAMLCFHAAYKTVLEAEKHENEGELALAYNEWGKIFKEYFPKPLDMLIQEMEDSGVSGAEALKIIIDRTS